MQGAREPEYVVMGLPVGRWQIKSSKKILTRLEIVYNLNGLLYHTTLTAPGRRFFKVLNLSSI
jgi:hypothetical protein